MNDPLSGGSGEMWARSYADSSRNNDRDRGGPAQRLGPRDSFDINASNYYSAKQRGGGDDFLGLRDNAYSGGFSGGHGGGGMSASSNSYQELTQQGQQPGMMSKG